MGSTYNAQSGPRVPPGANYFAPSAAPAPSESACDAIHTNGPLSGPVNVFNDTRLASGVAMQARAAYRHGDERSHADAVGPGRRRAFPRAPTTSGARPWTTTSN